MEWSYDDEFRRKATLSLAITGVALLIPFTVVHFVVGRYLLGGACLAIILTLGGNAWVSARGHYYPRLTLLVVLPVVLASLVLSFRLQGIVGALWSFPSIIIFYFILPEAMAWVSSVAIVALAVGSSWSVLPPDVVVRLGVTLAGVAAFSAIFVRMIGAQQKVLQTQAVTDPLTGAANRAMLASTLEQAVEQNRRSGAAMSILTVDLDHFKSVNDTFGHDAGDKLLKSTAEMLAARMRKSDRVFRLGGEEFLVLLYATKVQGATAVAEGIREGIAAIDVLPTRRVSASIGVAELQPGEDWGGWMKRCDQRLYEAKASGRNRVLA